MTDATLSRSIRREDVTSRGRAVAVAWGLANGSSAA